MNILDFFANYYASYGYLIIFLSILWDNTIILGYVMPAEVLVVMGGFFARQGKLSLSAMVVVGWFGMMIGQSVAYSIGSYGLASLVKKLRLTNQVKKAQAHFAKYGMFAVLIATFTGTTRTILSIAIGFSQTPYKKFVVWQAMCSSLWIAIYSSLGYFLGGQKELVEKIVGRIWILPTLILVTWLLINAFRWYRSRQKAR